MRKMDKEQFDGFQSGKGWEEKIWRKFLDKIEKAGGKRKTAEFLDSILSPNEKKLISKRLAALALIKSGKSYKEIGRALWISAGTISALKKSMLETSNYRSSRYYAVKGKNEKIKRTKGIPPSTILDYWANLPLPSKTGKGRWKFLNHLN